MLSGMPIFHPPESLFASSGKLSPWDNYWLPGMRDARTNDRCSLECLSFTRQSPLFASSGKLSPWDNYWLPGMRDARTNDRCSLECLSFTRQSPFSHPLASCLHGITIGCQEWGTQEQMIDALWNAYLSPARVPFRILWQAVSMG